MTTTSDHDLRSALSGRKPGGPLYATEVVETLLKGASDLGASDLHLQPTGTGFEARWRVDGVLRPPVVLPAEGGPQVVARLKVLADLLTYRTDVPQEGRIKAGGRPHEMRLSTLPTLHGEKAVVRLFAGEGRFLTLGDLGLPDPLRTELGERLGATSGAVLFTGPAGSGKTTTLYACLRELAARHHGARSLATLEDPIEVALDGVTQSQVNPVAGFGMEVGLRALLRQDPEVIAVGEIRDRSTAEVAFQASLTGHLVLSTFHAGSAASAVGRLNDMGIEPYLIKSGLLAVVGQRLVRKLCSCAGPTPDRLGLDVPSARGPVGCELCAGSGYRGRVALAEFFTLGGASVGRAVLERQDVSRIALAAREDGMIDLRRRAEAAVEAGTTSPAEILRVLGTTETTTS